MGHGPPGLRSTMEWPSLPIGGAHQSSSYRCSRVRFRASPKTEKRRGDRAMTVKKRRRWRLVRAMLKRGERGRRAGGGVVEDGGVLPFL
jgi:hypothetical protein